MLNAVTEKTGTAGAVLVRSVIPVAGINLMMINRNISSDSGNLPFSKDKIISESLKLYRIIASGPGRLTQAFNITGRNNGLDLTDFNSGLYILNSRGTEQVFENNNVTVIKSPRIGVSSGKDMHLRFFIDVKKFLNIKEEK
jgi:DNA-3-methyladenine glycosylase